MELDLISFKKFSAFKTISPDLSMLFTFLILFKSYGLFRVLSRRYEDEISSEGIKVWDSFNGLWGNIWKSAIDGL